MDVGFRICFDYTNHCSNADYVLHDCLTVHVIGSLFMVLNDLQAPAGEETGGGASDAVRSWLQSKGKIDTPVGPAAGVFVFGAGQRINQ